MFITAVEFKDNTCHVISFCHIVLINFITATAFIKGNTISTFDGVTYDLTSSCTFLMAKDNVDGNFSIVLHKEGDNKTLVVFADGKAVELFSNGKVHKLATSCLIQGCSVIKSLPIH